MTVIEKVRHPDQRGDGIRCHFAHDLPSVKLYSSFRNPGLGGNPAVLHSGHDEGHDLALSHCQRSIPCLQRSSQLRLPTAQGILAYRFVDGLQKVLLSNRFRQDIDCAGSHCTNGHWHIDMATDEDN